MEISDARVFANPQLYRDVIEEVLIYSETEYAICDRCKQITPRRNICDIETTNEDAVDLVVRNLLSKKQVAHICYDQDWREGCWEKFKEENGNVYVKCKNSSCKKWFVPSYNQIYERHRALTSPAGFEENNFYCTKKCKNTCILYGSTSDQLTNQREEYRVFNKYVLERDNYFCQFCGELATEVHHERPKKIEPFFSS